MANEQRRRQLSARLHELLGSDEVYFQGKGTKIDMTYPAIRYNRASNVRKPADNNAAYLNRDGYQVTIIALDPTYDLGLNFAEYFDYCSYDRWYTADGLNHWVYTLYF